MSDLSTERLLQCQEALGQLQEARAEIERLRAERLAFATESEERKAEIERLLAVCKDKTALLKDAYAEIERLRAVTQEAVLAALMHIKPDYRSPKQLDECAATIVRFIEGRRALEQKP